MFEPPDPTTANKGLTAEQEESCRRSISDCDRLDQILLSLSLWVNRQLLTGRPLSDFVKAPALIEVQAKLINIRPIVLVVSKLSEQSRNGCYLHSLSRQLLQSFDFTELRKLLSESEALVASLEITA